MISPHDVLVGFVYPLILASIVMLLTRRAWGAALAAASAYILGHIMIDGLPGCPPLLAYDWLVYAAVIGAIMGIIEAAPRMSPWLIALLRLLAVAGLVDVTLTPLIPHSLTTADALAWGISVTLLSTAIWSETSRASANSRGFTPAALWLIIIAAVSLTMVLAGSAKFMHFGGALVAALFPVTIFAAFKPGHNISRGLNAPCILILTGLLLNARFYADLPDWVSLVFILLPLTLCIKNKLLAFAAAVIPAVAVLIPLIIRLNRQMSEM